MACKKNILLNLIGVTSFFEHRMQINQTVEHEIKECRDQDHMDIEDLVLALAKKNYMFEDRKIEDFEGLIEDNDYDEAPEIEGDPPVIEDEPVDINALPYNFAKVLHESDLNLD